MTTSSIESSQPSSYPSTTEESTKKIAAATAQLHLGQRYEYGIGFDQDVKEAARLYKLAADAGLKVAQYRLAICHKEGKGVEQNLNEALRLLKLAAEEPNGYKTAQGELGFHYAKGIGIEQDFKEAARLFQLAVVGEEASMEFEFNLAICYEFGHGVERDLKEAVRFYKLAADKGFKPAQYNLAVHYEQGAGIDKDLKQAEQFYKKAAEGVDGYKLGAFNLGTQYERGLGGVDPDLEQAVRFYKLAADPDRDGEEWFKAFQYALDEKPTLGEHEFLSPQNDDGDDDEFDKLHSYLVEEPLSALDEELELHKTPDPFEFSALDKVMDEGLTRGVATLSHFFPKGLGDMAYQEFLQSASASGDMNASFILATMQKTKDATLKLFEKSSEQGNAYASLFLAYAYHKGLKLTTSPEITPIVVEQDLQKAAKFFRLTVSTAQEDVEILPVLAELTAAITHWAKDHLEQTSAFDAKLTRQKSFSPRGFFGNPSTQPKPTDYNSPAHDHSQLFESDTAEDKKTKNECQIEDESQCRP